MQPTLSDLKTIAYEAGKIQRAGYEGPLDIKSKGETDLVTEVDFRCESLVIDYIRRHFPGHAIVAEESGILEGDRDHTWYIDPLDGTVNYAHGVPFFCISIAYAENNQLKLGVIYDALRDECFAGERGQGAWLNERPIHVTSATRLNQSLLVTGAASLSSNPEPERYFNSLKTLMLATQGVRRLGSAALDLAYVAAGRLDGYWDMGVKAWDVAAGALIIEEAGGVVTTVKGQRDYMAPPYALLAATPGLHPILLDILQKA